MKGKTFEGRNFAIKKKRVDTYTKTPVTIEATNVPRIANVTIAPKFEKKGFCKIRENSTGFQSKEQNNRVENLKKTT